MEKKIQDYLHLYLGCEIDTNIQGQYVHPYGCVQLKNLTPENLYRILDTIIRDERMKEKWDEDSNHYCKPILRPLSDMTEDEIIAMFMFKWTKKPIKILRTGIDGNFMQIEYQKGEMTKSDWQDLIVMRPEQMAYLLKQGFDLFGLIESGLAIDASTLK